MSLFNAMQQRDQQNQMQRAPRQQGFTPPPGGGSPGFVNQMESANNVDRSASYQPDPWKREAPKQQPSQAQSSSQNPPTGSNSPVNSNGRISAGPPPAWSQAQAAPAQAAPAAAPAAVPAQLPGSPGPGWFQGPDGGWLPPDRATGPNAVAGAPQTGTGSQAGGPYNPATWAPGAPASPQQAQIVDPRQELQFDPNQFAQYNANANFSGYNGGQMVGERQGAEFSQYQNYGPGFNGQQNALMGAILQNPETMSKQNVAGLKEKQKETALAFQQQQAQGIGQNAAARGFSGSGGQAVGQQQQAAANTQSNLLKGYRDVDLQKMTQDRKDQYDALDASSGLMNSQQDRGIADYDSTLKGQQAQATENSGVWNDNLKGTTANNLLEQTRYASGQEAMANNNAERLNSYKSAADADTKALQRMGIGVDATNSFNTANLGASGQDLTRYGAEMDFLSGMQTRGLNDKLGTMANSIDTERNAISRTGTNNAYNLGLLGNQTDLLGLGMQNDQFGKRLGLDKTNSFYDYLLQAGKGIA